MKVTNDIKLDFTDILIKPKRSKLSSRKQVDLNRKFKFLYSNLVWEGVPIIAANMDGVGTINMANALMKYNMLTALVKSYRVEDLVRILAIKDKLTNFICVSTGTSNKDFERTIKILNTYKNINMICIDVANGYSEHFVEYIKKIRDKFPNKILIAGNVVTADMTQELILSGADIVKVGIGPGSVCTTRVKTGVGFPQFSAIMECADVAHGLGGHIISDGGCTCPGDVAKAFGAGADFVMLGGMLAGHEQGDGKIIEKKFISNELDYNGNQLVKTNKIVQFYGMSSDVAMKKHYGSVADYRSSEGRIVEVNYKGNVANTLIDLLGGIRSTCTYVGASKLKYLAKCATFIRVSHQINNPFNKNNTEL